MKSATIKKAKKAKSEVWEYQWSIMNDKTHHLSHAQDDAYTCKHEWGDLLQCEMCWFNQ